MAPAVRPVRTAYNKRPQGSSLQHYLKIEMLQAVDPNCLSCPSRRRLSTSVALEIFDDGSKRVSSVLRRPGCALPHDEQQLRNRPLGTQGNFLRAQRCAQCRSHRVDHSLNAADSLKISNVFKSAAHRFPTEALRLQRKPYFDAAVN